LGDEPHDLMYVVNQINMQLLIHYRAKSNSYEASAKELEREPLNCP
jgi:hypothetical protein